jgi:hypothetical protein
MGGPCRDQLACTDFPIDMMWNGMHHFQTMCELQVALRFVQTVPLMLISSRAFQVAVALSFRSVAKSRELTCSCDHV